MIRLKIAAALSAAAMLAACGGDKGGSGGGVVVVPTPTPTASPTPTSTNVAQVIADAEARGELPTLDRSVSLAGTDQNNDRLRDDLAAYIAAQSYSEPQKAALRQAGRAYGVAITAGNNDQDRNGILAANTALSRAIACIYARFPAEPDPLLAGEQVATMREFSANTRERAIAFLKFSAAMNGAVISIPKGDTCE